MPADTNPDPVKLCPDCGCGIKQHNAVNNVPAGLIAHCGGCGACWRSLNTEFVEAVKEDIEASIHD